MARRLSTACGPWFHGGAPGLDVGDELLPGIVTGIGAAPTINVTHHVALATSYAAFWRGGGDLYEVAVEHPTVPPIAEVAEAAIATPGAPWPPSDPFHFSVRAAAVVRVVRRAVPNALAPPVDPAHRRKVIKRKTDRTVVTDPTYKPDPCDRAQEGPMTTGEVPFDLSGFLIPERGHARNCPAKPQRQLAEVAPHPQFFNRLVVKVRCLDCAAERHSDVSCDELPDAEKGESDDTT